jgi:hypothetical protein
VNAKTISMAFLSSGKAEAVTNGLGIATTLLSLYSKLELQLWQMPPAASSITLPDAHAPDAGNGG